jgi:16S rRNA (uracil1498-N3)-methyltransferase
MFRVLVDVPESAPSSVRLEGAALHHLRVARVKTGEQVEVFDGRGRAWAARVEHLGEDHARLTLGQPRMVIVGRPVLLLQGLPKGDKLELVLQKATELGVAAIWPVTTARSVLRLTQAAAENRRARWQRIVEEAARQCGRADVPPVAPVRALSEAVQALPSGIQLLVLDEEERERRLSSATGDGSGPLALVVGPEGGLDREEVAELRQAGGESVTLGPLVLRTETAALVALAVLRHRQGLLG